MNLGVTKCQCVVKFCNDQSHSSTSSSFIFHYWLICDYVNLILPSNEVSIHLDNLRTTYLWASVCGKWSTVIQIHHLYLVLHFSSLCQMIRERLTYDSYPTDFWSSRDFRFNGVDAAASFGVSHFCVTASWRCFPRTRESCVLGWSLGFLSDRWCTETGKNNLMCFYMCPRSQFEWITKTSWNPSSEEWFHRIPQNGNWLMTGI